MSQALDLAMQGAQTVSPNPMVGCLLVKQGRIVGSGYHQRAGEAHAEVLALQAAGPEACGAIAYVTLEPCCHVGKTAPCTEALIQAGVKEVVVACLDPNPLVGGKGVASLRAAGIPVTIGICETEAAELNEIFFHYITHNRPFVIAKWAMSLDGKTVTHIDDSRFISSEDSHRYAHELRAQVDAILIGSKTACLDNPALTVRYIPSEKVFKQPIRIVVTTQVRLPSDLKIFNPDLPGKTWIAATSAMDIEFRKEMESKKITVLILPEDKKGHVSLSHLLAELGKRNISSLLVEGGMTLHESFFREKRVNKIHTFLAPVIIGSSDKKSFLSHINFKASGRDVLITATPGDDYV